VNDARNRTHSVVKKVSLSVNGRPVQVVAHGKDTLLLDVVRDDLGLTGTKQSCDKKGQCGTCMVLVDGKAVLSCTAKVEALDGAEITTIEGLGTPDRPNLVQQAFVLAGAVQCGFCIPGQLMSAHALLADNPHPSRAEVEEGMAGNLCRCGCYLQIFAAIDQAVAGKAPEVRAAGPEIHAAGATAGARTTAEGLDQ